MTGDNPIGSGFDAFAMDSTFNKAFMGVVINLSGFFALGPMSAFSSDTLVAPSLNLLAEQQGYLQYATSDGQQFASFGLIDRVVVRTIPSRAPSAYTQGA